MARVSSAAAATEFHSLSPPCYHSAETPGPFIPQPGACARVNSIQEGFVRGSLRASKETPLMFSASYQRYSKWREVFALAARGGAACANAMRANKARHTRIWRTTLERVGINGSVPSLTVVCYGQKNAGAHGRFFRAPASKGLYRRVSPIRRGTRRAGVGGT